MLLSRKQEVKIILDTLLKEKAELVQTIVNIKIWAYKSDTDLEESEIYLRAKANLQIVENQIKSYEELL